jgi:hypothetical protein
MNEIEFIVRRILKAGDEWSRNEYEARRGTPAINLHSFMAQQQLINYLEQTFLEGKSDEQN